MANFLRLSTVVAVSVAALLWVGVSAQNLEGVLSTKDQKRMESLLSSAQIDSDLTAAYQVVAGLSALSGKPSDSVLSKACNTAKSKASKDSLESLHQAAYIASIAGASCKLSVIGSEAALKGVLVDGATSQDLYFAISALTNLKFAIDDKKAVALLKAAVDNDDGALSYGMAFLGASLLKTKEDLKPLLESVEDVIGQADSTETTLYYSDGLSTTSAITVGMFSLMTAMNQDASLKSADVVKLSNYFLSSRYAASVSDSYSVVTAAAQLAKNKFYVPTVVVSEMKGPVTQANQNLKVRLTNIMDAGLGKADVTADVEDSTGKSVVKDKALSTADNVIYSMEMFTAVGSKPGTYTVKVKATFDSKSPAFSISQAVVMVSVAQKLTVTSAQLAIIDRDQDSSTAAGKALTYPGTSKESFTADSHQKVVLKFKLSTESPVHQSFVRMTRNGDDIFFIAEQDKSKAYVFADLQLQVVEVDRLNADASLQAVKDNLRTCSFVALDLELSGLGDTKGLNANSVDERYEVLCRTARSHSVLSLGVSCFTLSQPSDREQNEEEVDKEQPPLWTNQTFNILLLSQVPYTVDPGALQFLVRHEFDFNKQYALGVPYIPAHHVRQPKASQPSLTAALRDLLSVVHASRLPVVLHNGMVDLVFLYASLYTALPPTLPVLLADLSELFSGGVYDTKVIAEYERREEASFLEYLFAKCHRSNASMVDPHLSVVCKVPEGATDTETVVWSCPGTASETVEESSVCETFAHHGFCRDRESCPLSHDIHLVVALEERKRLLKLGRRRKRQKHSKSQRGEPQAKRPALASEDASLTEIFKAELESAKQKLSCSQGGEVVSNVNGKELSTSNVSAQNCEIESEISLASLPSGHSGDSLQGKKSPDRSSQTGDLSADLSCKKVAKSTPAGDSSAYRTHRAGVDAFMTGYCFAHYCSVLSGDQSQVRQSSLTDSELQNTSTLPTAGSSESEQSSQPHSSKLPIRTGGRGSTMIAHTAPPTSAPWLRGVVGTRNKIALSRKSIPLQICKSNFAKVSSAHATMLATMSNK